MIIEGAITILVGQDSTTIEIEDRNASTKFLSINLSPEQFCAALSRLSSVKCDLLLKGLEKIGKQHENTSLIFEIPEELYEYGNRDAEKLRELAQSQLTDGWIAEGYFGSQDSFLQKDGKYYAKCTIRRWL